MNDVEKAAFWIHDRKCRVLVFSFDGKVMDNDDTWYNLASAQSEALRATLNRFNETLDIAYLRAAVGILKESPDGLRGFKLAGIVKRLDYGIRGWTTQRALNRRRVKRTPHEVLSQWILQAWVDVRALFGCKWKSAGVRQRCLTVAAKIVKAERQPTDERWATSNVIELLQSPGIESVEKNARRLAVLADALEDAGCDDERILDTLRNGRFPDRLWQLIPADPATA